MEVNTAILTGTTLWPQIQILQVICIFQHNVSDHYIWGPSLVVGKLRWANEIYGPTFFTDELTADRTFQSFELETHKCLVTESSDEMRISLSFLFQIQIILKKSTLVYQLFTKCFITVRNSSCGNFHKRLSFCPRGMSASGSWGVHPPGQTPPPDGHCSRQ